MSALTRGVLEIAGHMLQTAAYRAPGAWVQPLEDIAAILFAAERAMRDLRKTREELVRDMLQPRRASAVFVAVDEVADEPTRKVRP